MRTVTGPELQDETYRMQLDLEPGRYRFIAYGGMACDERSFAFVQPAPGKGVKLEETTVIMDADLTTSVREKLRLHDLFWGSLTLETADLYNEGTVEMMKNTNNIRIVLQQMNGEPVKTKISTSVSRTTTRCSLPQTTICFRTERLPIRPGRRDKPRQA